MSCDWSIQHALRIARMGIVSGVFRSFLMPVLMRKTEEGEMVSFEYFIGDDMIAIVVGVFELHHVTTGEVRCGDWDDSVLAERSVHCGLRGDQESITRFQRVHNVSKRFDTIFIRECSLLHWKLTFDTVRQDRAVSLETFTLKGDLVHDDSLLEVDFVVGLEGSVVLESSHSFLGVTFGHCFLEEVDKTVGKVGETFESISEGISEDSP